MRGEMRVLRSRIQRTVRRLEVLKKTKQNDKRARIRLEYIQYIQFMEITEEQATNPT